MNNGFRKTTLALTLAAGLAGAAWAPSSHACASEPYISSICAMAWTYSGSFSQTYAPANGALIAVSQNSALFSMLGTAYGGNGSTTFALPDLRGRVIVGAGQGPGQPAYTVGYSGGSTSISLTESQMPQHSHGLTNVAVNTSGLTVNLSGLTGTLSGTAKLKASSGGTLGKNPAGSSIGTPTSVVNIYSDATPTLNMKDGSIDTSGLTVNVNSSGASIGGKATLGGTTDSAGNSTLVPTMPPYLAMTYFIAVSGIYPTRD